MINFFDLETSIEILKAKISKEFKIKNGTFIIYINYFRLKYLITFFVKFFFQFPIFNLI